MKDSEMQVCSIQIQVWGEQMKNKAILPNSVQSPSLRVKADNQKGELISLDAKDSLRKRTGLYPMPCFSEGEDSKSRRVWESKISEDPCLTGQIEPRKVPRYQGSPGLHEAAASG